jgi:hypothetical protein
MDDPWIMVLHTEHKSSAFREIKLKGFKRRENIWRSSWIEEHISAHEEWLSFLIALNIHQIWSILTAMALVSQWQATEHFCPFGDLHVNL